jgi:hypothetical protein
LPKEPRRFVGKIRKEKKESAPQAAEIAFQRGGRFLEKMGFSGAS